MSTVKQPEMYKNQHPRPDFYRPDWASLNGEWDFAWGEADQQEAPAFERTIQVPFAYQTPLSGIHDTTIQETVWYRRHFDVPAPLQGRRLLLHFEAVDYEAHVSLNGRYLGCHKGGYTGFCFDITGCVRDNDNELIVKAIDLCDTDQPRGKQFWQEQTNRCWYHGTTGIWQSVWLEAVGQNRIKAVKMTPDIDNSVLETELYLEEFDPVLQVHITAVYNGQTVKDMLVRPSNKHCRISINLLEDDFIDEIHYWSPECPNLYDITFALEKNGEVVDRVESYFGMRKIGVDNGRVMLNNRPYYLKMILDQGYWADGGLTAPSDEALVHDIEMTKQYGFNGARKHQKVEEARYYYWADKLGLLVWGEVPSAYQYNDNEVKNIFRDFTEFLSRDYNHPCIVAWVPLNESWGVRKMLTSTTQQSFGRALYHYAKTMDPMRLLSTNDGWENVTTDIVSLHDYSLDGDSFRRKYSSETLRSPEPVYPMGRRLYACNISYEGQPIMVTEYGGIAMQAAGRQGDPDMEGAEWGYAGLEPNEQALIRRYADVTLAIMELGFCGYCYTQLTDVYQEVNGLLDMNHNPKVDAESIRRINNGEHLPL